MDFQEAARWALQKTCQARREMGACDHPGCDKALQVFRFLSEQHNASKMQTQEYALVSESG